MQRILTSIGGPIMMGWISGRGTGPRPSGMRTGAGADRRESVLAGGPRHRRPAAPRADRPDPTPETGLVRDTGDAATDAAPRSGATDRRGEPDAVRGIRRPPRHPAGRRRNRLGG